MIANATLDGDILSVRIPMQLKRHGGRKLIVTPETEAQPARKPRQDETILVKAHRWRRRIDSGVAKSITDLAAQENVSDAYVCRLLPLTCLAPEIIAAILDGQQPRTVRLADLLAGLPMRWSEQRAASKS